MSSVKKQILIKPENGVTNVGFRPWLMEASLNYNLKCFPRNTSNNREEGRNCVSVILKGREKDINNFAEDLSDKKIHPPEIENFSVEDQGEYEGCEISWTYNASALTAGQMGAFVNEARKITKKLKKLDDINSNISNLADILKKKFEIEE